MNEKLPPFDLALNEYLYRQLRRSLKIDDLRFFFQFHPALQRIDLHHLLAHRWLQKLKGVHWPKLLQIKEIELPLEYIGNKPYLVLNTGSFTGSKPMRSASAQRRSPPVFACRDSYSPAGPPRPPITTPA